MTKLLNKTAVATAVGVFSLCFGGAANAVVDSPFGSSFGTLSAPASVSFGGHQDGPGVNLSADGQDAVSFSVSNTAGSNSGTIASAIDGNGWASFSTSLWDSSIQLVAGTVTSLGAGAWSSIFNYAPLTVAGSPYSIHIDGVTLSTSTQASYGGSMTISPIPEPETYAMLLAGLGLMGFVARRRQRNLAAA